MFCLFYIYNICICMFFPYIFFFCYYLLRSIKYLLFVFPIQSTPCISWRTTQYYFRTVLFCVLFEVCVSKYEQDNMNKSKNTSKKKSSSFIEAGRVIIIYFYIFFCFYHLYTGYVYGWTEHQPTCSHPKRKKTFFLWYRATFNTIIF